MIRIFCRIILTILLILMALTVESMRNDNYIVMFVGIKLNADNIESLALCVFAGQIT